VRKRHVQLWKQNGMIRTFCGVMAPDTHPLMVREDRLPDFEASEICTPCGWGIKKRDNDNARVAARKL